MTLQRLTTDFTFQTFDPDLPGLHSEENASLRSALRAALNFAESRQGFLTLLGGSGSGKTHLAAAIAGKALAAGDSVAFVSVPDLLDELRSASRPGPGEEGDRLLATIREVDLLVLDDLAGSASTPWAQEKLFQIINYRSLGNKPTVVTLASSIDDIGQPRLASRLTDPRSANAVFINAPHYTIGRRLPGDPGRSRSSR